MEEEKKPTEATPVKKKSNTLLYIILGIVGFFVIMGIVVFLFLGSVFLKVSEKIEDISNEPVETVETEDGEEWMYKKETEEKVDGNLEKSDLVSSKFPEDIPLSGGIVKSSKYDDFAIEVVIDVNSTVEEAMEWYATKLVEKGWEITGRSSQESIEGWISGYIDFAMGEENETRRGRISFDTDPYKDYTTIVVKELLY
jgi:hypothetical protein